MMTNPAPKFGHYALPEGREALRLRADKCGDSRLGRWGISYWRKRAFKGLDGPFDVTVLPGVKARLYPRTNRCEKRVFAGQHIWDAPERAALLGALENSTSAPFVFFDVGANVGLYSLMLAAKAREIDCDALITAIEPDTTNRSRFEFNIGASGANITVLPYAISDEEGEGVMGGGEVNRGEVKLQSGAAGTSVLIKTLYTVCKAAGISHIDAMKVDIEGHDLRALTAFFKDAPQTLWPRLLILETGRGATTPLLELCAARGYTIHTRTGINSILVRGT